MIVQRPGVSIVRVPLPFTVQIDAVADVAVTESPLFEIALSAVVYELFQALEDGCGTEDKVCVRNKNVTKTTPSAPFPAVAVLTPVPPPPPPHPVFAAPFPARTALVPPVPPVLHPLADEDVLFQTPAPPPPP